MGIGLGLLCSCQSHLTWFTVSEFTKGNLRYSSQPLILSYGLDHLYLQVQFFFPKKKVQFFISAIDSKKFSYRIQKINYYLRFRLQDVLNLIKVKLLLNLTKFIEKNNTT